MFGGLLWDGVFIVLGLVLFFNVIPYDLAAALNTSGNAAYAIPSGPWYQFLASLVQNIGILAVIILGSFLFWSLPAMVGNTFMPIRSVFAWSFDRLLPEKFAEVNERTHSPVPAILLVMALVTGMQAMYDLVGDRIQEIFDAQVVDIGMFDFEAGVIHYPYTIERGVRFPDISTPIERAHLARALIETRQPVLINDVPSWEAANGLASAPIQGEPSLSVLLAPLTSGGQLRGRISLQNLDRINAFSETDVRLLTTLAASLSVALENARLFDETKRRAAELAIVNDVQAALAAELEPQAMYELVGARANDVFDSQVVDIAVFDHDARQAGWHLRTAAARAVRHDLLDPRPPRGLEGCQGRCDRRHVTQRLGQNHAVLGGHRGTLAGGR